MQPRRVDCWIRVFFLRQYWCVCARPVTRVANCCAPAMSRVRSILLLARQFYYSRYYYLRDWLAQIAGAQQCTALRARDLRAPSPAMSRVPCGMAKAPLNRADIRCRMSTRVAVAASWTSPLFFLFFCCKGPRSAAAAREGAALGARGTSSRSVWRM
jgi:hypothetical protein